MKLAVFLLFTSTLALFQQGEGYSFGAPSSTCFTIYPKHSNSPTRISQCPYELKFTPNPFRPGEEVTVEVEDPKGSMLKGIILGAHQENDNTQAFIGQFVDYPVDKIKVFNCFTGFQNMITHKNNNTVRSVSLKWKAPNQYVGDVTFKGTYLAEYGTFWVNIEHTLTAAPSNAQPAPSSFPAVLTHGLVGDIDFSACGDTKGCFMYPRACGGDDCTAVATYQYRSDTDDFLVELFTKEGPNYISFGLSDDQIMGNDATYTCASNMGLISIQPGWNPGYYNERQLTRNMSGLEVREQDGNIMCRFVMPGVIQVYHMLQDTLTFDYTTQAFDTKEEWYLMLAWGPTMPGSDVITHHKEMPATTFSKVNMRDVTISYGSAFHNLVRVHGAMMIVGWVLLTGITTVISRHYKNWLSEKTLCGTKVWFQVHREVAILVTICTGIGLAVVFAHYGSEIREYSTPHSYIGLAVTACVGLQLVAGFLRPGGDHKLRPVFNWGHRFLGQATHILSAVAMYYVFEIEYITPSMRRFGFITLSVWVGGQVLWHIIFEMVNDRKRKPEKSDNYDLDAGKAEENFEKYSKFETFLLIIYICSLAIFCVAVMCSFLLY